jgi:RimJ/RimL family protein N-acetyltransferase
VQPVLEANAAHLAPWIPAHVASPAALPELEARLAGFVRRFDERREWRWGLFSVETEAVLGEVGLFPRLESGRVAFEAADRVEIGYWLRADATGRGLATEAARAALTIAASLDGMRCVEIRCDERNALSAAVPRRLGFRLDRTLAERPMAPGADGVQLQVWQLALPMPIRDTEDAWPRG